MNAKIKILIADDSEKLLSVLRLQLEHHGFEVTTCIDAYMALSQARQVLPDVLVLDIRMPAGNGFSVLERMAKIPGLSDTPVIYMTGDQAMELDLQAEQLGAIGLMRKPISFPVLLKLIDNAVEGRYSCGQPATPELWPIPDPVESQPYVIREEHG